MVNKMTRDIRVSLLDLDGTLLDTLMDIGEAMNRVLMKHGLPAHPMSDYRYFVGDGATMLVKRAIPQDLRKEDKIEELKREFLHDYGLNWRVHTRVYPGIADMLDFLSDQGIKLTVLSNKPHEFTLQCVNTFLSDWHFEIILGERKGIPRKPDPAGAIEIAKAISTPPQQFVYLGDTSIDMKTAVTAGMFPVGVSWGFRDIDELIKNGARKVVDHPRELIDLLKELSN